MPEVTGYVTYDVQVECPHCGKNLHLNQYPYNDEQTDYYLATDDLILALFGISTKPAIWSNINIEYVCCICKAKFSLSNIET